jgi:hypothetical protein
MLTLAHHDAVAIAMQFAMVRATEGDRIFVADLPPECAGLGKTKVVRVGRRAATHDAGLTGHESGVLLVAQTNGLAHDGAAGADFLRYFRENIDAVCAFDARLFPASDMHGFGRRFFRRLVGERFQLRLEAVFDEMRVGGPQQVLVGEPPVNPIRRLVGGRKTIEFGKQTIAQNGGLLGRQNGPRGGGRTSAYLGSRPAAPWLRISPTSRHPRAPRSFHFLMAGRLRSSRRLQDPMRRDRPPPRCRPG